jgi:hypothetical protein
MVADKDVAEKLMSTITQLVEDASLTERMQSKIKSFAWLDADKVIATTIINHLENSNSK